MWKKKGCYSAAVMKLRKTSPLFVLIQQYTRYLSLGELTQILNMHLEVCNQLLCLI